MTLTPDEIEALKYIGGAVFALLSGGGVGAHLNKRKNAGWCEEKDHDRRIPDHNHPNNGNGKQKPVPQSECTLRHEKEEERWKSLLKNYGDMQQDIRGINDTLRGD